MKNLSKVLAVVLALVMALSMVSFAAYTDVADDANYAEAVSVLSSLDMLKGYEDGTFKPEGDITRAEFAMVVCRLLGYGATAEVPASYAPFNDVPADHWASGAIALAAQQGIVNGYGDGNFGPEDNVTYEQAIKMVVAALGQTIVAEANGGYPGGFQIVAAQAGILDGITDGKAGVAASRGVVAQLAYNALEVPMMSQTGFGDEVKYDYDNTLLLNRIGVVKVKATIEGTAKTADVKDDEIKLDFTDDLTGATYKYAALKSNNEGAWVAFNYPGTKPDLTNLMSATKLKATADAVAKAEALIDYEVEVYVKDATTRNAVIVAIEKQDLGYNEIAFATEEIDETKTDLVSARKFVSIFTDEAKDASEKYEVNITKIYLNGNSEGHSLTAAAIFADDAEADIRLLDQQGDGVYDIAYVTAYVDYVVESLNARKYRVITEGAMESALMGTWPSTLVLDEENDAYSFEIVKDGEVVDFTAIAENDVLSIAGGLTNTNELKYGTVIINTQSVSGKIDGLDTENKIVYIDGVAYPYNDEVSLTLGDEADFYINARGIICGLDETSKVGNLKYGFVTVAMESTGLTADTMELRMMDTEGTWNTYVLDKDFDLDGVAGTVDVFKDLGDNSVNSAKYVYNTLVAYELNADGEIDNLYVTPAAESDFVSDGNTSNLDYNAATEMYNGNVLTDATVIFTVPETVSTTVAVDEDLVAIATKDVLVDRANYKMTAFNSTDDGEATILLGYGITGRIDWAANFMVITGTATRTNADGVVGVQLTGLVNGEEVTLFSSTESGGAKVYNTTVPASGDYAGKILEGSDQGYASVLAKGDVILYSVNGAGEAAKIVRVQAASAMKSALYPMAGDPATLQDPAFDAAAVKVGEKDVAGTTYTYYLGYVATLKGTRLTIQDRIAATAEDSKVLTLKADSIVTEVDLAHATGVKVLAGDLGSFTADSAITAEEGVAKDGDIALIKTVNGVVVVEAVVFKGRD